MPGRDQTGPVGTGPNGRGLGPCRNPSGSPRRGRRGGFGRRWFQQGSGSEQDLRTEESFLKKRLAEIQEKLKK